MVYFFIAQNLHVFSPSCSEFVDVVLRFPSWDDNVVDAVLCILTGNSSPSPPTRASKPFAIPEEVCHR